MTTEPLEPRENLRTDFDLASVPVEDVNVFQTDRSIRTQLQNEVSGKHMTGEFKEYLGAIEVEINGVQYEIGLRQEHLRCIRGLWTCMTCRSTEITSEVKPTEGEAIELAKVELRLHHDKLHHQKRVKIPRQNG